MGGPRRIRRGYASSRSWRSSRNDRGVPTQKKLLVGYSDVTVLHEFVRQRWGWSTLHAPMPAASNFAEVRPPRVAGDRRLREGQTRGAAVAGHHAAVDESPARQILRGELIGGNLSLWAALAGTPLARTPGKGRSFSSKTSTRPSIGSIG